jgi:DNA-binding transcriptional MocR family regulator
MSAERIISETELYAALKSGRGARCEAQVKLAKLLIDRYGEGKKVLMPNLAELARELGVNRQAVSAALHSLVKKGIVTLGQTQITQPAQHKTARALSIAVPDPAQPGLPFAAPLADFPTPPRRRRTTPVFGPPAPACAVCGQPEPAHAC